MKQYAPLQLKWQHVPTHILCCLTTLALFVLMQPPLPAKSLKEYVDLFKSIRQPALLIDGEEDVPGATGVQRMAADLADVRTFNVSGSRHFPHMERPETVNTLIQHWLQSKVMIAA